jgi:hypothetical protein
MVTYETTTLVAPHLVEAYERYMGERHVPDLLDTGCFQSAVFTRSAPGRYRVRYEARTDADLERYLVTHAARLREEFAVYFPEGVSTTREVWVAIQTWDAAPGSAG